MYIFILLVSWRIFPLRELLDKRFGYAELKGMGNIFYDEEEDGQAKKMTMKTKSVEYHTISSINELLKRVQLLFLAMKPMDVAQSL